MNIFSRDKWRKTRDDLVMIGKAAKELLPGDVEDSVRLLMGASPTERELYRPYLTHLSKGNVHDELAKFPQDVIDACSVRLLCVATNRLDLIAHGWSVSIDSLTLNELSPRALPLLSQLTDLLVKQQNWEMLFIYRVGEFLSSAAHQLWGRNYPLSEIQRAIARGLYAQGAAALSKGDKTAAKRTWTFATIYAKDSDDFALTLCQQGLAKLG